MRFLHLVSVHNAKTVIGIVKERLGLCAVKKGEFRGDFIGKIG
jgi:hypothetical protein